MDKVLASLRGGEEMMKFGGAWWGRNKRAAASQRGLKILRA